MRVVVLGAGYVGLTAAAGLAALGHNVIDVDTDKAKVARLAAGIVDIDEPHLLQLVTAAAGENRLRFTCDAQSVVPAAEVVIVCLPTPMRPDGAADTTAIEHAAAMLREHLAERALLVIRSTTPVGTAARTTAMLNRPDVAVVANPEFLREGSAVDDFLRPDRIVIGADSPTAARRVAELYDRIDAPILMMSTASAELTKYAANTYLAMRVSYINEIAMLSDEVGADVADIIDALGRDPRIGPRHLAPGPGWGGPCLPKDTAAILATATVVGLDLPVLKAIIDSNARHQRRLLDRIRDAAGGTLTGRRIGVLGLTFKAETNDARNSPAVAIANLIAAEYAETTAYDPSSPLGLAELSDSVTVTADPYRAVKDADVVVVLTEWPVFSILDWRRVADLMAGRIVIDCREVLDRDTLGLTGLTLDTLGRVHAAPTPEDTANRAQTARGESSGSRPI